MRAEVLVGLRLRRLPEPVEWVAPAGGFPGAEPGPLPASALRLVLDAGPERLVGVAARGAGPVVTVRTAASAGAAGDATVRWTGTPEGVRAAARVFPSSARVTFDRATAMVRALARDLGLPASRLEPERHVLLCFADGGDGAGGLIASALSHAAPGVALAGGTFAGGVAFDGTVRPGGAVVVLAASEAPVRAFEAHPYALTERRVVVTGCDDTGLIVSELDGFPAAARFADLAGVPPAALDQPAHRVMAALQRQLAWVVRGRMLLRPVVGRHAASLVLGAPVQPGLVLRLVERHARPADAVLAGLQDAVSTLPARPAAAWAFLCRGLMMGSCGAPIREGLSRLGVVGCAVDGAFHGPVHSCGTVSGVVFGDAGTIG